MSDGLDQARIDEMERVCLEALAEAKEAAEKAHHDLDAHASREDRNEAALKTVQYALAQHAVANVNLMREVFALKQALGDLQARLDSGPAPSARKPRKGAARGKSAPSDEDAQPGPSRSS